MASAAAVADEGITYFSSYKIEYSADRNVFSVASRIGEKKPTEGVEDGVQSNPAAAKKFISPIQELLRMRT